MDHRERYDHRFLDKSPALYRLAKSMTRRRIRGGGRLMSYLEKTNQLAGKAASFKLGAQTIFVPLDRPEHWDQYDVDHYEIDLIDLISKQAATFDNGTTLIDCGADIGIISMMLASRIESINQIVAFEPSPEAFPVLKKNLSDLSIPTQPMQLAVSDFTGRGELRSPEYDANHFARYLAPMEGGSIAVASIDDCVSDAPNVIIKIDVEGGETGVLAGARRVMASATNLIVVLEAHPKVFSRTGIDPVTIFGSLQQQRPFRFIVAEHEDQSIDLTRSFFEQFTDPDAVYNVVCVSP